MKSKIHFEKKSILHALAWGCAPRRGGAVINIHVFLPLKVTVLFKNHRSGEERG